MRTFSEACQAIIAAANAANAAGLTPATGGNFSIRLPDGRIAISRSGADKGALASTDILLVDAEGQPLRGNAPALQPSAETRLHCQIYQLRPAARAIWHVHSVQATVLGRRCQAAGETAITLAGYEMLKAFAAIDTHATTLRLPVIANDQDMERLRQAIAPVLANDDAAWAYLLAGHGAYVWGRDPAEASRHLQALEFLLACHAAECQLDPKGAL